MEKTTIAMVYFNESKHHTYIQALGRKEVRSPSYKTRAWNIDLNDEKEIRELAAMYSDFNTSEKRFGFVHLGMFFHLDEVNSLLNTVQQELLAA